jgi:cell wall-associated NlpC family hydrolase
VATTYLGRHRAPRRSADNLLRSGAVLAAAGGLVSAFGLPVAQAAPRAVLVETPSASAQAASAAFRAPVGVGPVRSSYGVIGVKAVAKPKPKPKPIVAAAAVGALGARTSAPASRSNTTPRSSGPARPAPAVPAHGGVLAVAAALSGIPYVYGGSTPAGFDCSGFTSYVFRQVGISLPRTAAGQQAVVTPVSNPQPGDLVFMGYPAYHVGIYAGNGMMYDSPRSGLSSGLRAIWSSSATYGRP